MVCGLSPRRPIHATRILKIAVDCAFFSRGDSVRGFANQCYYHQTVGKLISSIILSLMWFKGDADLEKAAPALLEVIFDNCIDVVLP